MAEEEKELGREGESAAQRGDHLTSPDPGHPVGDTQPPGGIPDRPHEHPEDLDDTTPDQQSSP